MKRVYCAKNTMDPEISRGCCFGNRADIWSVKSHASVILKSFLRIINSNDNSMSVSHASTRDALSFYCHVSYDQDKHRDCIGVVVCRDK